MFQVGDRIFRNFNRANKFAKKNGNPEITQHLKGFYIGARIDKKIERSIQIGVTQINFFHGRIV